ncbi:MAG: PIN domain-containing protein [Sphingomonadales bacterium]
MSDSVFADTNILIYAVLDQGSKVEAAQSVLAAGPVISVQVLNEFAAVSRGKFAKSWSEIEEALDIVRTLVRTILPLTIETHDAAMSIAARYKLRVYDAMIVAAAAGAGCSILLSEDMQHGQVIDGVRIANPFDLS